MRLEFASETALAAAAAEAARCWREAGCDRLVVGLVGELGVGKTAWVRAMLRGLGFAGRVPSPTYTLLEQYELPSLNELPSLTILHLDLYRLNDPGELEYLGIRDWMAVAGVWMLVEWPERSPSLTSRLDIELGLAIAADDVRLLVPQARTATGEKALSVWLR